MSKSTLTLIAGFIAGCGFAFLAPRLVPPAHAQATPRWEMQCRAVVSGPNIPSLVQAIMTAGNGAGRDGWEPFSLLGGNASGGVVAGGVICFKRPAP